MRVLDLTSLLPGPFASQILADLGATVIKVERPGGDPMRHIGQGRFSAVNRGKHSVVLDLKAGDDRSVLLELVVEADVLMESNRPGVMDRLGLGPDRLRELRPGLVYVSLSGWGQTGPAAQDPGHNATYLARAGATHLTGPPGSDPSDEVPVEIADLGAALYSVIGILSALRNRRPEGVRLDISLFGSAVALLAPRLAEYAGKGNPSRDDLLRRPAHGTFRTADGRFLTIAAVEDSFWIGLCEAIGRPDLGRRQDLADYNARCAHADEIDEAVSAALGSGSCEHWLDILRQYDVPAVPVLEPWQLPDDPQVRHLGALPAWPDVRAFLPISGLSTTTATAVPEIDSSGPAIRRSGWAGLTLIPDSKREDSAHG